MVAGYNQRYQDNSISRRTVPAEPTPKSVDVFAQARTVSLYQYVDDVLIGTGRDENGELYDMRIPIAIDLYYSPEFGGVNVRYPMADWKSTEKEIVMRGWYYKNKTFTRATKDGREFGEYMRDCLTTIEYAVNQHFSPKEPEVEIVTKVVAPFWSWITLVSTVILVVLLVLSNRP